ncbi:hypothetical protein BKA63DRAFT_84772 [Paraphoma chrysanthemicola]|nr:hypothetical protein BKA63DRAFT_84772 [Paraphoma chrysanthemicola]
MTSRHLCLTVMKDLLQSKVVGIMDGTGEWRWSIMCLHQDFSSFCIHILPGAARCLFVPALVPEYGHGHQVSMPVHAFAASPVAIVPVLVKSLLGLHLLKKTPQRTHIALLSTCTCFPRARKRLKIPTS